MLGNPSPWLSLRRARGAGSVFMAAAAVWAAVACSSDDDSSSTDDQGSGGSGGSSGGSDSAGGSGGAPSDGGGGDTSSGGTDGDSSSGGSGGSNTPGDFSSVWQAESVELMLYDTANQAVPELQTVEMPAKVESPIDGREVEFYVTFEGEQRITYAYTDGDSAYYRLSETALSVSGDFYAVQSEDGSHSYSIEDGKLTEIAQQVFGSAWSAITTTTYKKVEDFPPSDWPSEVLDYEVGGAE